MHAYTHHKQHKTFLGLHTLNSNDFQTLASLEKRKTEGAKLNYRLLKGMKGKRVVKITKTLS